MNLHTLDHIQHVGMNSETNKLQIDTKNADLAKDLLKAFGMTVKTDKEMAGVLEVVDKFGLENVSDSLKNLSDWFGGGVFNCYGP